MGKINSQIHHKKIKALTFFYNEKGTRNMSVI